MKVRPTPLAGVTLIDTDTFRDARGEFVRVFCAGQMAALHPDLRFVQVNLSRTRAAGTVRGLHLQRSPVQEIKLIRCLRGRVFDVIVDLRADSPTYRRWFGVVLDAAADTQVLVPYGCAHGFQTLTDHVELLYQHSAPYTPALETGVRFDDPALAIEWPLAVVNVSERDRSFELLSGLIEAA